MIPDRIVTQLDELLNHSKQVWLLGAGISKDAGVPLMYPLTNRIQVELSEEFTTDYQDLRTRLRDGANVEHILSRIGSLIDLAEHSSDRTAPFGNGEKRSIDELFRLHQAIQEKLRTIIRWGYYPPDSESGERVGSRDDPVISVANHRRFVDSIFSSRRAGLERRPPVAVFTTNYDTLLEDAFALNEVKTADGFSGGSMAFWNPQSEAYNFLEPFERAPGLDAKLYKLHGSIDWYYSKRSVVMRRREGAVYSAEEAERLLVYPQATKYQTTQQEPFSHLFRAFRRALNSSDEGILCICGYGFGDRHINHEIENSLSRPSNQLTTIACCKEERDGETEAGSNLPRALRRWLEAQNSWTDRLIVVSDRGFYHGTPENQLAEDTAWNLWSFQGLTAFLSRGPEGINDV